MRSQFEYFNLLALRIVGDTFLRLNIECIRNVAWYEMSRIDQTFLLFTVKINIEMNSNVKRLF